MAFAYQALSGSEIHPIQRRWQDRTNDYMVLLRSGR